MLGWIPASSVLAIPRAFRSRVVRGCGNGSPMRGECSLLAVSLGLVDLASLVRLSAWSASWESN